MSLGRLFGWLPPGEDGTLGSLGRSSAGADSVSGSSSGSASNGSSGGGSSGSSSDGPFAAAWRLLRGGAPGSNTVRPSGDPYAQAAARQHAPSQRRGKDLRFMVVDVALQVAAVGLAYVLTQQLLRLWDHVQV